MLEDTFPLDALDEANSPLPWPVAEFLRTADGRIREYLHDRHGHGAGFVPSDFPLVYRALEGVVEDSLAPGNRLCEWGSGFGVVAALAAMLEFDAYGIEIQDELVRVAGELVEEFGIEVVFARGTFIPAAAEELADDAGEFSWHDRGADAAYDELELELADFDVIYAYPWPGEESLFDAVFDHHAAVGSLLITYHGASGLRMQRKTRAAPGQLLLL